MKSKVKMWTRRRVLRGVLAGSAVTVGLPLLDCVLNENGTAFADTGAPMPTRFVSWFWPLGLGEGSWWPKTAGADYEMPFELAALKPFKKKMNLYTGSQVVLDGSSNVTHFTGPQGYLTGTVSSDDVYVNSADAIIANTISSRSRFRSMVASCAGDPRSSWTAFAGGKVPSEVSPAALYARLFGPEFIDPNAATFTPDPGVMVRRSVLSAVNEDRAQLMKNLGASDRQRLDYYFTALRSLEQRLDIELQKPPEMQACTKPQAPEDDGHAVSLATDAIARHDLFGALITHALACDQTRMAALNVADAQSPLRQKGEAATHHSYTHEEPLDPVLGYQVKVAWFATTYFNGLSNFVTMLDSVKEGDGSLLDHMVLLGFTDHGQARTHSVRNYPFVSIGGASGRIKTGMHFAMQGDTSARVAFTMQKAMGVPTGSWGTGSNRCTYPIGGVLA